MPYLVCVVASLLLVTPAGRAQLPHSADFYRVEVPVRDTSAPVRRKALLGAFEVMLQRMTGERDASRLAGWSAIRSDPSRYTAGLKYFNRPLAQLSLYDKLKTSQYLGARNGAATAAPDNSAPATSAAGSANTGTQITILEVSFDRVALERLMEDYAWARWPASRPKVAVWVFRRQGFREDIVPADYRDGGLFDRAEIARYTQSLDYLFSRFGLEYTLPQARWLEEHASKLAQVRSGRFEQVAQYYAQQAYSEFVVVRVRASGASHSASFVRIRLTRNAVAGSSTWESYGNTLEDVLRDGGDSLFARMVADYVRDAGSLQDIDLHLDVRRVESLDDYARVLDYLSRMPQSVDVQVLRVSERGVEFMLKIRGVWSDVLRVFSSASIFEVARFEQAHTAPASDLPEAGFGASSSTPPDASDDTVVSASGSSVPGADTGTGADQGHSRALPRRQFRVRHYLYAVLRH